MKKFVPGIFLLIAAFLFLSPAMAQATKKIKKTGTVKKTASFKTNKQQEPMRVRILTDSGTIVVKLYDSTPIHRDNFVKLVKEGFYDSLLFHRVIAGFMIQGGDPTSKNAPAGVMLGNGGGDMERLTAEFSPALFHKKGALAAARDGNPEKKSSACQFYIVEGKPVSDAQLNQLDNSRTTKYTAEQKNIYKTLGGTPFLDMNYTVFGEVETGLEVISKIAGVSKDGADRPLGDIRMRMELVQ